MSLTCAMKDLRVGVSAALSIAMLSACVVLAPPPARAADALPPPPNTDLYVYPVKGQTPDQVDRDRNLNNFDFESLWLFGVDTGDGLTKEIAAASPFSASAVAYRHLLSAACALWAIRWRKPAANDCSSRMPS